MVKNGHRTPITIKRSLRTGVISLKHPHRQMMMFLARPLIGGPMIQIASVPQEILSAAALNTGSFPVRRPGMINVRKVTGHHRTMISTGWIVVAMTI